MICEARSHLNPGGRTHSLVCRSMSLRIILQTEKNDIMENLLSKTGQMICGTTSVGFEQPGENIQ